LAWARCAITRQGRFCNSYASREICPKSGSLALFDEKGGAVKQGSIKSLRQFDAGASQLGAA